KDIQREQTPPNICLGSRSERARKPRFRSNAPRENFMSKIVTLLFLAAALLVCTPSTIRTCSCDDFPSHQKEFKSSQAVFVGQVLAIEKRVHSARRLDTPKTLSRH